MEYAKNLRFLIFLVLIFYSLSLVSQDTWVKTYRPFQQQYLTDRYSVEDVLVTQDGGFVVSGSFELFDEFYYEHWGFLMKTDSDGNVLWAKKDSVDFMSENGYNVDFTELQDGSFISIGYQGFGGNRYMIKRDANGNRLWATSFDPNFGVFSMQTTDDSNVILAGRSDYNAALRKITPDGNLIWTNIIDLESSIAFSVDQADDGGYLLTGKSYIDDNNILVVKTNSNGDSLWTRTFDGLGGNDKGHCVIETADGNILIGGNVQVPSPDYGFGFLACLETNGDTLWTKIFDDGYFTQ